MKERPPPGFQIMVANGQLEKPKAKVELKFEVGDNELQRDIHNNGQSNGNINTPQVLTKKSHSVRHETRNTQFPVLLHAT